MADLITLDGFHAWKHAVRFGATLLSAHTDDPDGLRAMVAQLAPDLAGAAAAMEVVEPQQLMARCTELGMARPHHTRIVAVASQPGGTASALATSGRGGRTAVLVDHPRNPGNLGAVIRVAAAAGAAGVLSTGTLDPWHRDVVRAAAGLHWATSVHHVQDGTEPAVEGPVLVLEPDGVDIRELEVIPGTLIVVGAERAGISPVWRERAAAAVSLPMQPGVSSLNLATTVSAVLYHVLLRTSRASHHGATMANDRSTESTASTGKQRKLVKASGGVVSRPDDPNRVLVVHRPHYDDWSFPKGKLDPGETDEQCALREVLEESGVSCTLGAELSPVNYEDRKGRPKLVRYWAMVASAGHDRPFVPNDEVDEIRWLTASEARALLTYPHDRALLDGW